MKELSKQTAVAASSIAELSSTIGGKGANLEFLRSIDNGYVRVPRFCSIYNFSESNIRELEDTFAGSLVAVRSSGLQEDSNESSLAGCFHTELNIPATEIKEAIERIHRHSVKKANERIPLIIQEMVQSEYAGVVFTYDMDERKPYFVINIGEGLGESLVSGEQTGKTYKILSGVSPESIHDERLRNLYQAVREIQKHYPTPNIDVEFGFQKNSTIPYILQVRPIVGVPKSNNNNEDGHCLKLAQRYASRLVSHLEKTGEVYGDMIDINPQELVGNQPIIIKSFFDHIFPKSSLIKARDFLGYQQGTPIMELPLGNPYVSLERDVPLFLPKGLSKKVVNEFINYYKKLLFREPNLQNALDSNHYPNNHNQLDKVLSEISLSDTEKDDVRKIFGRFLDKLEERLFEFDRDLEGDLHNVFASLSAITGKKIAGIGDLTNVDFGVVDSSKIPELLSLIKELTFMFVIAARGYFYFNSKDPKTDDEFFKSRKYEWYIYHYMLSKGIERLEFQSTEGFNFLKVISSCYTMEGLKKMVSHHPIDDLHVNQTSKFEVHRENIKYIFTRLFLILHNSIANGGEIAGYTDFMKLTDDLCSGNIQTNTERKRSNRRNEVNKILLFPGLMHSRNSPMFLKLDEGGGHFIGSGVLTGEILYVNSISELEGKDLSDSIICIENATPEIDVFLPNIRGIITRNGGPLAHIAIRAREYKIPAIVGIGSLFDDIKKSNNVEVNFDTGKIIAS